MTRFLDVSSLAALIQTIGIERVLAEMANTIATDYRHWTDFEKSARVASHSDLGVIELMPTSNGKLYSFKYVNGHPSNTAQGLPTVMAFGMLADVATGLPLLLSEMTLLTALRTAATSALAASHMAKPGAKTMAVIGCGAQSEFQILAFKAVMGIKTFFLFDIDPKAVAKVQRNLELYEDIKLEVTSSGVEAMRDADIITTLTASKTKAVVVTPHSVKAGIHINAVGGDCPGKTELHADLLRGAHVAVEFEPQTRIEGEIQQMPSDFPVTPLWEIVSGRKAGRSSDDQVTIFDSVGFAIEDFSALRYVYEMAQKHNSGKILDLIPQLDEPRDLFKALQQRPK